MTLGHAAAAEARATESGPGSRSLGTETSAANRSAARLQLDLKGEALEVVVCHEDKERAPS